MKKKFIPFAFVAPALLFLAAMLIWPLFEALILSFQDVRSVGSPGNWVGFENYRTILDDEDFWGASWLSLVWVITNAVFQTILALAVALALNQNFPGVKLARTWIILTWIIPTIVVVMIWRWLFSTSGGIINPMLMGLGIVDKPVGFFSGQTIAFATLVFINSWRWFPFITLMILAGLTRIPSDLYEAARVDGASSWKQFSRITWPLLAPTLGVLMVIGTLLSFNVFDIIWLLTAGGPADATRTLPVLIYETGFKSYRMSEAAAIAVMATVFLMLFALFATRWLAKPPENR